MSNEEQKLIAKCVKQYIILRKMKKMYQRDVADLTGISLSHIEKIEVGRRQPTLSMLSKLAWAVGGELAIIGSGR